MGANACAELNRKLAKITALTDYAREVTTSVGHMRGGQDKFNIVCGEAEAKVDTRFFDVKNRDRMHAAILKILKEPGIRSADGKQVTTTEFTIESDTPPMESSPESQPYLRAYLAAIQAVEGKPAEALATGGSGDANNLARPGSIILDGLGAVGDGMHTPQEFVNLDSIESRPESFVRFLTGLK